MIFMNGGKKNKMKPNHSSTTQQREFNLVIKLELYVWFVCHLHLRIQLKMVYV